LDVVALAWFLSLWLGYARFAHVRGHRVASLMSVMGKYRQEWWMRIIERELRMIDTSIVANLANSATFFASTTLLILGGLLALLGTTAKVVEVVKGLPFNARATTSQMWELKIMLLLAIFVYAFFKFTWSLRQFNFSSVLIGAAPKVPERAEQELDYIHRAATLSSSASDSFNYGLRAYYFGLAALAWFLNAWLFIAATTWIVGVLYWREFRSETLKVLDRATQQHK